jgi:hypothetical protein
VTRDVPRVPEAARQFFDVEDGDGLALPAAAEPFDVRGDLRVLRSLGGI